MVVCFSFNDTRIKYEFQKILQIATAITMVYCSTQQGSTMNAHYDAEFTDKFSQQLYGIKERIVKAKADRGFSQGYSGDINIALKAFAEASADLAKYFIQHKGGQNFPVLYTQTIKYIQQHPKTQRKAQDIVDRFVALAQQYWDFPVRIYHQDIYISYMLKR